MDTDNDDLRAHIARLERRIAELEQDRSAPPKSEPETTPSRRNLFRLGAVGLAGTAVAAVSRPGAAAAACGTPIYADCDNVVGGVVIAGETDRSDFGVLSLYNRYSGGRCIVLNRFAGLAAQSPAGDGVIGDTDTGNYGVAGYHSKADGLPSGTAGVYGVHLNTDGTGTGVIGKHLGGGWGMWAISKSGKGLHADGGTGIGAEGVTTGAGPNSYGVIGRVTSTTPDDGATAVRATTASTTAASCAVRASHAGSGTSIYGSSVSGTGVRGVSPNGRGGVFTGAKAQINLTPGALADHPTSGQRGDLYVDSTGRLWFCSVTGSTATWIQLG